MAPKFKPGDRVQFSSRGRVLLRGTVREYGERCLYRVDGIEQVCQGYDVLFDGCSTVEPNVAEPSLDFLGEQRGG